MRCQFCGWDNPQGKENCEKCGKPLQSGTADQEPNVHERPTTRYPAQGNVVGKATVREPQLENMGTIVPEGEKECPRCGYTLDNGECPSCGYKKEDAPTPNSSVVSLSQSTGKAKETVRPIRKGEKEGAFTLTPISEETGKPEGEILPYKGKLILLNRNNTDPKNNTITSSEQASVSHEGGRWFIKDNSEHKTTFVQAVRKIELQDGDLILLGNQLYCFNSIKQ